jgi:hypothetical protein
MGLGLESDLVFRLGKGGGYAQDSGRPVIGGGFSFCNNSQSI